MSLKFPATLLLALATAIPARADAPEPIEFSFAAPKEIAFRRGVLVLPNFGLAVHGEGSAARAFALAPRMGAILGWHFATWFTMNAEFGLQVTPLRGHNSIGDYASGFRFDYGVSPLLHLGTPRIEAIVGPKVGRFRYWLGDENYGESLHGASGWGWGANLGLLARLDSMALGGLATYTKYSATELCTEPFPRICHSPDSSAGDFSTMSFSLALLY